MNIRMTQELRISIAKNAKRLSPINKQLEKVLNDRYALVEKIRIESLGGKEKANLYEQARMALQRIRDELPDEVITSDMGIQYRNYFYVLFNEDERRHILNLKSPEVCNKTNYILSDSPYLKDLKESFEYVEKYKKDLKDLEKEVLSTLSSISTVKKLLDIWPEAKELIPSKILEVKTNLPALKTDKLNSLIGLPSNKK